jgi:hypothetical protein
VKQGSCPACVGSRPTLACDAQRGQLAAVGSLQLALFAPCALSSQIKSIWSVLLRNFEFELLDRVPAADYESMVIGPKPCRVKFRRRKLL